jgi:hypothetical protein
MKLLTKVGVGLGTQSPQCGLDVASGVSFRRTTTATSYTVLPTDALVSVTSTAAARTITLPAASAFGNGQFVTIVDESGGASVNNITIARAGTDTINGATSFVLNKNNSSVTLYSNGSNAWFTSMNLNGAQGAQGLSGQIASYTTAFASGSLVAGILTVTHNLSQTYVSVSVYNNSSQLIIPNQITLVNGNSCTVDLNGHVVSGTWFVVVLAAGGANVAVGSPFTGGTANEVLYVDGSGNLAQSSALFFNSATNQMGVGASTLLGALTATSNAGSANAAAVALYNSGGGASASVSADFYTTSTNSGIPLSQVKAVDDGNSSNHLFFSTKTPGASTNALALRGQMSSLGSWVLNNGTLAVGATDGFTYIPGCQGTPTGTPTNWPGVPVVYNTTGNTLYAFNSTWQPIGTQGNQGLPGVTDALHYTFSTATTTGAAGTSAGGVDFSSATYSSITSININKTDRLGVLETNVLNQIKVGTVIQVFNEAGTATYVYFLVTSVTSNTNDYTIGVTYLSATGAVFTNGQTVSISFGIQGPQGATGSNGGVGSQGNQGNQGNQGVAGSNGGVGSQGNQGNQGVAGSNGGVGSQGNQGNQGVAGSNGGAGSAGAQGNQGNQGTAGSNGGTGSAGAQGNQGNQGTAGSNGGTGSAGAQGNQGNQGNQGVIGTTPAIGGSNTQVQYNNSGALGGATNLTWDNTNTTLTLTGAADAKHLVLKANSTQTATNVVEVQTSAGVPTTVIDGLGYAFPRPICFVLGSGTPCTTGVNKTNQIASERSGKIVKAFINAKTPPTGAALIIDIKKNGTSIWNSTPANRLQLAATASTGTQTSFDTTTVAEGDLFTIDVAQVGSTVPGQDVTVQLLLVLRNQ